MFQRSSHARTGDSERSATSQRKKKWERGESTGTKKAASVSFKFKELPGVKKVQEKEKMLLPTSCSQKRFQTEPWSA